MNVWENRVVENQKKAAELVTSFAKELSEAWRRAKQEEELRKKDEDKHE